MQNLIDRLLTLELATVQGSEFEQELQSIIGGLKLLDQEHARQTDELRGLRETTHEIRLTVQHARRQHNIWQDEISGPADDVAFLLTDMGNRLSAATDDAASLRGTLESIRDTAREAENDDGDTTKTQRRMYILDLLGSVSYKAAEGLKAHHSGAFAAQRLAAASGDG